MILTKNGHTITRTITVTLTAEGWQLYDRPGAEEAAKAINQAIEQSYNRHDSRRECEKQAWAVMRRYEDLGAFDTEPLAVLQDLLDEFYPN